MFFIVTFVWSILDYDAVIWDLHTAENAYHLERVHSMFFICQLLFPFICPHNYYPVASFPGLVPLAEHRCVFGIQ